MNKEDLQQIAELLAPISERLDQMGGRLDRLESDTRQTRVLVEQQQHQIQLIAEQYADIAEKLDLANERAAQIDDIKTRLRAVEIAVMRHSAILKEAQ